MKRIAVLTSGGDAPGMNAAVRAVVRTGAELGMEVYGIQYGYLGLIEDRPADPETNQKADIRLLKKRDVCDVIHRGGTFLYTARCLKFKDPEGIQMGIDTCKKYGIEGIVVIGGDGSFRGARDLSNAGIPCIGIPATIDNDISCCDYTIGYDTSLNTITQMVDRVRETIEAHDRCSVVEVMGRNAGHLTLEAGIAVGATSILVPEIPYDIERDVLNRIQETRKTGKKHFLIMVSEGIGGVEPLARLIESRLGVESRALVLGHVQRGGSPTVRDRVVASKMGNMAVHMLHEGKSNRVIAMRKEQIEDFDINEALEMKKDIDKSLFEVAMEISL